LTCTSPSPENHICKFCAQQIGYVYCKNDFQYYCCENCNVQYGYVDHIRKSTKLFTSIDDGYFVAVITRYGTDIYRTNGKIDVTKVFPGVERMVIQFDEGKAPELTPENVSRKLKTILVFS
jgi:hypothetical protein